MVQMLTESLLIVAMCILALTGIGYLIRTIVGPNFTDRILAVNSVQTVVILIICIIAVLQGESYIVDVALIYASLGFVTVVIVCKAYLRSHHKDRANDLANLRGGQQND